MRALLSSEFMEWGRFFVYYSVRTEVDTRGIVLALGCRGKQVCLPRIEGKNMLAAPYSGRLVQGSFGIPEPSEGGDTPCDIALVPLLAFDQTGCRLGYGGGYYDRYFAARPNVLRVGLAYDGQAAESLPREGTDIPLHAVVTESGVKRFE